MISLFELLYLIAREVKDRPVPPTDPATTPRTIGDVLNLKKAAAAAVAARMSEASAANKALADAQEADSTANTMVKAHLKGPVFIQDAQGVEVFQPDSSDVGFHSFRPMGADTPLDEATPPVPGPPPEPAPEPAPVIPGPEAAPESAPPAA
jgi:hypothetical protein